MLPLINFCGQSREFLKKVPRVMGNCRPNLGVNLGKFCFNNGDDAEASLGKVCDDAGAGLGTLPHHVPSFR